MHEAPPVVYSLVFSCQGARQRSGKAQVVSGGNETASGRKYYSPLWFTVSTLRCPSQGSSEVLDVETRLMMFLRRSSPFRGARWIWRLAQSRLRFGQVTPFEWQPQTECVLTHVHAVSRVNQ